MNVTLAQLRAFERIVRLGSFHAAARDLNLTQPSVSQRIRELEELRAKAGGIQIGGARGLAAAPSAGAADEGDTSPMARLQRAKDMLQNGLLNDAEFEQIKAKILAEL